MITPMTAQTESRSEAAQRKGKRLILAGFGITLAGVLAYSIACLAAGSSADLGDIIIKDAVPFAHSTLVLMGFGTLVWLIGSVTYLKGAIDADDESAVTIQTTAASRESGAPTEAMGARLVPSGSK